jgi:hypothetical protein
MFLISIFLSIKNTEGLWLAESGDTVCSAEKRAKK